jgi:hypothetical protein
MIRYTVIIPHVVDPFTVHVDRAVVRNDAAAIANMVPIGSVEHEVSLGALGAVVRTFRRDRILARIISRALKVALHIQERRM